MGEKKQAAAKAAARFLYMVVLYMAPVEQK
jgi:hypothetical protein